MNRWMIPLACSLAVAATSTHAQAPPPAVPPAPAPPAAPDAAGKPSPAPPPEVAAADRLLSQAAGNRRRREALRKEVVEMEARLRAATAAGDAAAAEKLRKALVWSRAELASQDREVFRGIPGQYGAGLFVPGEDAGPKITLNLNEAPPREAFRYVLDAAKLDYVFAGDIPNEPKVTLKVSNVRVGTALTILSDASGVGVTPTIDSGKLRYRIGGPKQPFAQVPVMDRIFKVAPQPGGPLEIVPGQPRPLDVTVQRLFFTEERSMFNCPHCKGQVTVLRKRQQPRCPKCSRMFQPDWQFCPNDGTKRPETAGEWKFCPLCGKPVKLGKSDAAPGFGFTPSLEFTFPADATPQEVELEFRDGEPAAPPAPAGPAIPPAPPVVPPPAPAEPSLPSSTPPGTPAVPAPPSNLAKPTRLTKPVTPALPLKPASAAVPKP